MGRFSGVQIRSGSGVIWVVKRAMVRYGLPGPSCSSNAQGELLALAGIQYGLSIAVAIRYIEKCGLEGLNKLKAVIAGHDHGERGLQKWKEDKALKSLDDNLIRRSSNLN